jgi:hypothetical protein
MEILSSVIYGFETWYFKLREEHTLWVFENGVLRKEFGALERKGCRKTGEKIA